MQIDSVSVVVPAHYVPAFSRLGPYNRAALDDLIYGKHEFIETWAHEASIVPADQWALLRHKRLAHDRRLRALAMFMTASAVYAGEVLDRVRVRGPLIAADVPEPDGRKGKAGQWWGWTAAKAALEGLFAAGTLAIARRRAAGFAREYDLAERVIAAEHRVEHDADPALRALLLIAARALGVGTVTDIADYHRANIKEARATVAALVSDGLLREVRVEGWREPALMHPQAKLPRSIECAALLSPFDPVVWHRPRAARLFGFDYRIEIYVPAPKRKYGYYVMPFLLNDRLVGRVDLKTDRASSSLIVRASHVEAHARPKVVATALCGELRSMARWLGLDDVRIEAKGNLARQLRGVMRA